MMSRRGLLSGAFLALLALPLSASADLPGRHPFYLHALSELRGARWLLERRPGDPAVRSNEDLATIEIDRAIDEIRRAAIDDGKDLHAHPGIDLPPGRRGRLGKALELLRQARSDVARGEQDRFTRGLRDRAARHIDGAIQATQAALAEVRYRR